MLKNKFAKENLESFNGAEKSISDIFILLGDLNHSVIVSAITIIENKLSILDFSKSVIKKAKLIAIELLENVSKHQVEGTDFSPYFELSIGDDSLKFTTGNCISKMDSEKLGDKLSEYSALPPEKIKEKYYEALSNGELDEEGNAGLGLLTLMNRSQKQYDYKIDKISDTEYFFNSTISIENAKRLK